MKTRYEALEELAKKASPGPWKGDRIDGTVKYELLDTNGACVIRGDNCNSGGVDPCYGIMRQEDEDFLLGAHPAAVADLIADVRALAEALSKRVDSAEECAFDEWLNRTTPSGDITDVQNQWEDSSEFSDFCETWKGEIAALSRIQEAK